MQDRESELSRFSIKEYEQIESKVRSIRRGRLKTYLDECDITDDRSKFAAMRDADPDTVTQQQVYDYLGTRRGALDAILIAAKTAALESPDAFAESYDIVDASNLARFLVGFEERVDLAIKSKRGKKDPNPQASAESSPTDASQI